MSMPRKSREHKLKTRLRNQNEFIARLKEDAQRLQKHRERRRLNQREYRLKNRSKFLQDQREYYETNKDRIAERARLWYIKTKESRRHIRTEYVRNRRKSDPLYRLLSNIRTRIADALAGRKKAARTMQMVGCSIEFLREHLQSKFKRGMSWRNRRRWHIDHVVPCAKFDLSKHEEQIKCFHWSNLQPMWVKQNLMKRDKIFPNTQPELLLKIQ